jgi:hypothetical protein
MGWTRWVPQVHRPRSGQAAPAPGSVVVETRPALPAIRSARSQALDLSFRACRQLRMRARQKPTGTGQPPHDPGSPVPRGPPSHPRSIAGNHDDRSIAEEIKSIGEYHQLERPAGPPGPDHRRGTAESGLVRQATGPRSSQAVEPRPTDCRVLAPTGVR